MKMNQNFAKKAMLLASLTLGIIGFNSNLGHARKAPPETGDFGTNWKSEKISCTVTNTIQLGGDPFGHVGQTESYQGTKRVCYKGSGLCFMNGWCS